MSRRGGGWGVCGGKANYHCVLIFPFMHAPAGAEGWLMCGSYLMVDSGSVG